MANQNAKRNIVQDQYYNLLNQMAESGDKAGINKILSSPSFQKLKMAAGLGKTAAVLGRDPIVAGVGQIGGDLLSGVSQGAAGILLGLNSPQSGKNTAKMQSQAYQRKLNAMAGTGTGFGDVKAAAGNTASNIMQLGKAGFYTSSLMGATNPALSGFMSSGMMASALNGGVGGLGATAAGGLSSAAGALGLGSGATSAIAAANPMMMGIMAMMAATKGGKALYNYTQKDSSTNVTIDRRSMITRGTSPHQLEQDYGNTGTLRIKIRQLQNMGQLKPGEALIADILAMIEGHTSVLPYIAAEAVDNESRKNKEGGFAGHDNLNNLFGDNGDIRNVEPLKKESILGRIFTSLELGSSNLLNTFDPGTYISALLQGKSVTEMYNTANSKQKGIDALKSEEQFASQTGTSVGMVQAIHTTPSQIMDKVDTFEAKQLSVLGLISEINRFSAHELLKIRMDGFGIKNATSHGLLAELRDKNLAEDMADEGRYANLIRSIDNTLGYIPGYNVLSGSYKMVKSGSNWMKDMFLGDRTGEKDEYGKDIRKKNRSVKEVLNDWLSDDLRNETLDSEARLRTSVGAVELGPQELMANYMGKAYPDRFELLLKYNLSQMESLKALAGPIKRSNFEALSMNKYDGTFANSDYHKSKDADIRKKMRSEMNFLNETPSFLSSWYGSVNKEQAIQSQLDKASETNPFLKTFLDSNGQSIKSNKGLGRAGKKQLSAEDLQNQQKSEELAEHKMSLAEQQVSLLQDIRDCLNCKGEDYKLRNKKAREEAAEDGDTNFGWLDLGGDGGKKNKKNKPKKTKKPKLTLFKKIKEFFSLKSLKSMFKGGKILSTLTSLATRIPVFGSLLVNPVVLTAIGVAAAGYGFYKLGSWVKEKLFGKEDEEAGESLSDYSKHRAITDTRAIDAMVANATKETGESEKALQKFSKDNFGKITDIDKLRFMLKISNNSFTRAAIRARIIELGGEIESTSRVTGYLDSDFIESNNFNSGEDSKWKVGAVQSISNMSYEKLQDFKRTEYDNLSVSMRKEFDIIYKKRTSAQKYKSKNNSDAARFKNNNFPFFNKVTSEYGIIRDFPHYKKPTPHTGIDFGATPKGSNMKLTAVAAGKVLRVVPDNGKGTGQGHSIVIKTDEGDVYCYWHLQSKPTLKPGSRVERGQEVGNMGSTGGSQGVHLHLGLYEAGYEYGKWRDPSEWLYEQISQPLDGKESGIAHGKNEHEQEGNASDVSDPDATYAQRKTEELATKATAASKEKIEAAQRGFNNHTDIIKNSHGGITKGDLGSLLTQQTLLTQQMNITQNEDTKKLLAHQIKMLGLIVDTLKEDKTKVLSLNSKLTEDYDNILKRMPVQIQ